MKLKFSLVFLLFFVSTLVTKAQNDTNKWTFGVSAASALYFEQDKKAIGGAFINQTPRLTISRYLFNNLTMVGSYATSALDTQKYTTLDGSLRYDFGASYDNVVPYVMLGGSLITAQQLTPTLNFGVGNTFWFLPSYGVNFQLMYRFSETRFTTQFSHFYSSIGLVYSFKPRNMNMRLWDRKH
ncbi:hypothetical protein [Polaribacter glomeratus]|uniref:Outer membrane protein beta-barrel domain-containing protein n=1 Tax=Polaribacter glomeratus TaxID=102 RepID=A0A2S7WIR8_9FLAO|nr:hypothetical protein [Polaribacter glomeratus]PQJ77211.1 hypothetical protein BTO16_15340 [Polaribacter glomeratus]TXD65139.1 hypothetical protein ESX12_11730 [Polaribacter glomeratus]